MVAHIELRVIGYIVVEDRFVLRLFDLFFAVLLALRGLRRSLEISRVCKNIIG